MIVWHKHHIVPKHAGGTDEPSNLLKCNIAMHTFMHEQRYKELGDEYDKIAAQTLRGQIGKSEAANLARSEGHKRFLSKPESRDILRDSQSKSVAKRIENGTGFQQSIDAMTEVKCKNWKLTSPTGDEALIRNLSLFCRENGLIRENLQKVARGERKHHKGWKCQRMED